MRSGNIREPLGRQACAGTLTSQYSPPTKTLPPITLPRITHAWFHRNPVQVTESACGRNSAMPNKDRFAMLCSNPLPTNAKRHQKIRISFAESLVVRPAVQTARQTSQLHRRPRTSNSHPDRLIFVAATFINKTLCGLCDSTPDCATSHARARDPIRLPTKGKVHRRPRVRHEITPSSTPIAQIMLLPVNNSEPAKMTQTERDRRKDAPCELQRGPLPLLRMARPTLKMSVIPKAK